MAQTTVSIRMDNDLKNSFDHICNELGMSMSTAVTMLAKKMTREQRLPFELSVDPFYSEQNQARLRKSIAEMEATGGTIHEVNLNDQGMGGGQNRPVRLPLQRQISAPAAPPGAVFCFVRMQNSNL